MKDRSKKRPSASERYMQLRVPQDNKAGAELVEKIRKISAASGLSLNDVANMCVAAGLGIVERKLTEIRTPEPAEAA